MHPLSLCLEVFILKSPGATCHDVRSSEIQIRVYQDPSGSFFLSFLILVQYAGYEPIYHFRTTHFLVKAPLLVCIRIRYTPAEYSEVFQIIE
jgi:hypothetical protein